MLWLWHRPAGTAPIRSLAWEPICRGPKKTKDQKKKKKRKETYYYVNENRRSNLVHTIYLSPLWTYNAVLSCLLLVYIILDYLFKRINKSFEQSVKKKID